MEATSQFAAVLAEPDAGIRLDLANLLIAAHAYPGLRVEDHLGRIDALAARCPEPTLDGLLRLLFVDERFTGNRLQYFDPRNSFLNDVLDRRQGIPLSLAVLTMSVGHRVGVPVVGVAMPGHFLLRDRVDPELFIDPFRGGARLDRAGCEIAFRAVQGDGVPFDPTWLEPVSHGAILVRMLANLRAVYASVGDRDNLLWVLRLRGLLPTVPVEERAELPALLAATGRFGAAALEYDALADSVDPSLGREYRRQAERLRARMN